MSVFADAINQLITAQYASVNEFGELAQLSLLFDSGFLQSLIDIIAQNPAPSTIPNNKRRYQITLCWIDKSPLADFTSQNIIDHNNHLITQRVELGDLALFFIEEPHTRQSNIPVKSYAAIIQAKVSESSNNALPKVPVGSRKSQNDSTAKELALLSKWPTLNLYKSSRSTSPLLRNIALSASNYPQYGWYMACHKEHASSWESRWMCAPAILDQLCDITIGKLLESFVHRSAPKPSVPLVGEAFNLMPNNPKATSDWDRVCNKVLELCCLSKLPKPYFSSPANRKISAEALVQEACKQFLVAGNRCGIINHLLFYSAVDNFLASLNPNPNLVRHPYRAFRG